MMHYAYHACNGMYSFNQQQCTCHGQAVHKLMLSTFVCEVLSTFVCEVLSKSQVTRVTRSWCSVDEKTSMRSAFWNKDWHTKLLRYRVVATYPSMGFVNQLRNVRRAGGEAVVGQRIRPNSCDSATIVILTDKRIGQSDSKLKVQYMNAIMDCEIKNVHYTETERMLLAQLISQEKAIENKRTGAADLKDKAEAWERIARRYCSQGFPARTSKQLKKCWDNMKQKKKKLNTSIKVQHLMTGGGVSPAVPVDPVMDFMDAATPNLDIEVPCPFDSTAQFEKEYHIKSNSKRQLISSDTEDGDSILIADDMENVSSRVVLHTENSIDQYSMSNVNKIAAGGTMKRNCLCVCESEGRSFAVHVPR